MSGPGPTLAPIPESSSIPGAGADRVAWPQSSTVLHDCAVCLPDVEAVVIIDSALRRGVVTVQDWPAVAEAGPHAQRVAEVLASADPLAQSVLESVGRVALRLAGFATVESQVYFSAVGWVDLVLDGWLVIELDGWEFHRDKFQDDRRRDAELSRQGCVVLRFTYADLMSRRAWFIDVVREVLDRGGRPSRCVGTGRLETFGRKAPVDTPRTATCARRVVGESRRTVSASALGSEPGAGAVGRVAAEDPFGGQAAADQHHRHAHPRDGARTRRRRRSRPRGWAAGRARSGRRCARRRRARRAPCPGRPSPRA